MSERFNSVICIPTYKRPRICNDKTLTMLAVNNIPSDKINVYVANQDEYDAYVQVLDKSKYNQLIIGKLGLVQQRDFISSQFPEGACIVFMDDDIDSVDTGEMVLDDFIKFAFKECECKRAYIWGVYPVFNPFFREKQKPVSTCLNYIVGAFYGIINRLDEPELELTRDDSAKEDVERSIKYFIRDGVVLRFNRVGFKTKYYNTVGGLGNFESRLEPMRVASLKLQAQYPEYGRVKTRKSGMTEFVLKKRLLPKIEII